MPHQREILELAFTFDENGRLPYDTVIYSCPKKSGKTTLNAALTLWWALTQEAPNECLMVANDLEQAKARAFASCEGIINYNPELKAECEVQQKNIFLDNGTAITAISSDYQGASGSNHGWVSYEEIWAVTSESGRRLFEELTSVPPRRNSVKFIATYAGFEGESQLLMDLYKKAVGREEHPEGQGVRIHPDLPIYVNREARIFCYWDHEARMPWQKQEYYDSQRRTLRPATFQRLHQNQWVSSENRFIDEQTYDACVEPGRPDLSGSLFIGVDAAIRKDNLAVVAVKYDDHTDRLVLADVKIWKPLPGQQINLESSVEFYLRQIYNQPRARIEKILVFLILTSDAASNIGQRRGRRRFHGAYPLVRTEVPVFFRASSASRFYRILNTVCAFFVCSYIFFDVLDLDGSDFLRFLSPLQKTIIVGVISSEADLYNSHERLGHRHTTLIPFIPRSESFTSSQRATLSILSSLYSARAHGYKVSLARNSLSDSSPYD